MSEPIISEPMLNQSRDLLMIDHATLSKAFSKSTVRRRPGFLLKFVYTRTLYNSLKFSPMYLPFKKKTFGHCELSVEAVLIRAAIHDDAIL